MNGGPFCVGIYSLRLWDLLFGLEGGGVIDGYRQLL